MDEDDRKLRELEEDAAAKNTATEPLPPDRDREATAEERDAYIRLARYRRRSR